MRDGMTVRVHFISGDVRIVPAINIKHVGEEGARSATALYGDKEYPIYNRPDWPDPWLWEEQEPDEENEEDEQFWEDYANHQYDDVPGIDSDASEEEEEEPTDRSDAPTMDELVSEAIHAFCQALTGETDEQALADDGPFGDPRTSEEIEAEIASYQPGYVRSNPFAHDGLPDCQCASCYLARKKQAQEDEQALAEDLAKIEAETGDTLIINLGAKSIVEQPEDDSIWYQSDWM